MLVHKYTLGVLQWYWDGESYVTFDGVTRPKMAPVTLESHDLSPDEWWQVPNGTPLAKRIALHYPFFDPVVTDGELVGVQVWPAWKRYGEEPSETVEMPVLAPRRKYNRRKKQS